MTLSVSENIEEWKSPNSLLRPGGNVLIFTKNMLGSLFSHFQGEFCIKPMAYYYSKKKIPFGAYLSFLFR